MTTIPQIPSDTTTTKPHINPNPNPPQRPPDLPRLPIPPLKDTCARYLRALEALQSPKEHAKTKEVVREFLESGEGELWQEKLEEYAKDKESYIEEFWCRFIVCEINRI